MSTYRMSDGTIVKTENAVKEWDEETDWNGNNHISRATGSQWNHQKLYKTRKNRYWIEHTSQWQGSMPTAEWVSLEEAFRWLNIMNHDIPDDLKKFEETLEE